jgi:hypothetical protein
MNALTSSSVVPRASDLLDAVALYRQGRIDGRRHVTGSCPGVWMAASDSPGAASGEEAGWLLYLQGFCDSLSAYGVAS